MGNLLMRMTRPSGRSDPVFLALEKRVERATDLWTAAFLLNDDTVKPEKVMSAVSLEQQLSEVDTVFQKWWFRPGTLEDYANPLLQVGYVRELLKSRVANDFEYCQLAAAAGSRIGTGGSSWNKLHLCALGCGPASELWGLCLFLCLEGCSWGKRHLLGRNEDPQTGFLSSALLVDAAPWGRAVTELQKAFARTGLSEKGTEVEEEAPFAVPLTFLQEDAFAQPPGVWTAKKYLNLAPRHAGEIEASSGSPPSGGVLNVLCMYRLTWDVGAERMKRWMRGFLRVLDEDELRDVAVEIWIADAAATSKVYSDVIKEDTEVDAGKPTLSESWDFQVLIEEARTKHHRNFYTFFRRKIEK
eukprot:g13610.t1